MPFRSRNFSARNATALTAGGVLLGVLGSRLLPPLVGIVTGRVRARMGQDPFELLKQDHRSIRETLNAMAALDENSSLARRTARLLQLKRLLSKHATAEEDVVYPILHDQAGAKDAAMNLYNEHAEMKMHLYHLEAALKSGSGWADHVKQLRDLINKHVEEEEGTEFPRLRNMMDEKKQRAVAGQIHREEAMVL